MLIFFQKYLKYLNLLLLAILGLASGILAGALMDSSLHSFPRNEKKMLSVAQKTTTGVPAADLDLILQRNMFDPDGRNAKASLQKEIVIGDERTTTTSGRTEEMTLYGTVVAQMKSLALIASGTDLAIYPLQGELASGGRIEEIYRKRVVIRNPDGTTTNLEIRETPDTTSTAPSASSPSPTKENAAGIRQIDENKWVIARETVEMTRQNLGDELRLAQMSPRVIGGQTSGFTINTMQGRSILNKIGLRRGDVILKVNDMALTSPEKALQILQQLREARQITIDVERRGKPVNFAYELE